MKKHFSLNLNDYIVSQHMTGPQGATGPGASTPPNYGGGGGGGMMNVGGAGGYVHVQWPAPSAGASLGAAGPTGPTGQGCYDTADQPELTRIGKVSAAVWASAHQSKRVQWINAINFDNDLQFECAAMGMDETFRKYDSADLTDMYLRQIQAGVVGGAGSFVVPQGVTHMNVSLVGGGGGGGSSSRPSPWGGAGGGGIDEYTKDLCVMLREERDEKRKRSWLDRFLDWWLFRWAK